MHGSVIPCSWPWGKLLERSGSSLDGPEKVATVKVTSIPFTPPLPSPPHLSPAFCCFFFSSTNVSNHAVTHIYNKLERIPSCYSRASNLNSPLHFSSACALARLEISSGCGRNENETEPQNAESCNRELLNVRFEYHNRYRVCFSHKNNDLFIDILY